MRAGHVFSDVSRFSLILIITISLTPFFTIGSAASSSSYYHKYVVDQNGVTSVNVDFESSDTTSSSWVFVPKFTSWSRSVTVGSITQYQTVETSQVPGVDEEYYFYQAFTFSFKSSAGSFKMNIQFSVSTGALIIEPRGMFFSPQIGFESSSTGRAEVVFPKGYKVKEALASGLNTYNPTQTTANSVLFNLQENIMRLQVEFSTDVSTPALTTIKQGVFSFEAVKRYESYARDILRVFNTVYSNLTRLFNVTLTSVEVRFFIPDFDTFLSVGGYVPFTQGEIGEININIFFVRAVNGTIEVIAVHELVHHFVWADKLSPDDFLWFHEGMAQFASIEVVDALGYEGAKYEKERLEQVAAQLGGNFGFVQQWSPNSQPQSIGLYYAASYYVVNELAKIYSGFDFYRSFFELTQNVTVSDNNLLAYYLSKAANASVALVLRDWGFSVTDLYTSPLLIDEAERALAQLSPIFQPYKFLAEYLFRQALLSFEIGNVERANAFLQLAIFIAYLAPLLTLLTIAVLLLVVVYIIYRYRARTKPGAQPSSITMETVG